MREILGRELLDLAVLRKKTGWDNIDKEYYSNKYDNGYMFTIAPTKRHCPPIVFYSDKNCDFIDPVCFGNGHFHAEGREPEWRNIWRVIKYIRDMVAKKICQVEYFGKDGVTYMGGGTVPSDGWPAFLSTSVCTRWQGGATGLVDAKGAHWRYPKFKRYIFNQQPFFDEPPPGTYVPIKYGWATRAKRDELAEAETKLLGLGIEIESVLLNRDSPLFQARKNKDAQP